MLPCCVKELDKFFQSTLAKKLIALMLTFSIRFTFISNVEMNAFIEERKFTKTGNQCIVMINACRKYSGIRNESNFRPCAICFANHLYIVQRLAAFIFLYKYFSFSVY